MVSMINSSNYGKIKKDGKRREVFNHLFPSLSCDYIDKISMMYLANQRTIKTNEQSKQPTRSNISFVSCSVASYSCQNRSNPATIKTSVTIHDVIIFFTSFSLCAPQTMLAKARSRVGRGLADLQGKYLTLL